MADKKQWYPTELADGVKVEWFEKEQDAFVCARGHNGISERHDWKELPDSHKKTPWSARWGPGIVPPVEVPIGQDAQKLEIEKLRTEVAQLQAAMAQQQLAQLQAATAKAEQRNKGST